MPALQHVHAFCFPQDGMRQPRLPSFVAPMCAMNALPGVIRPRPSSFSYDGAKYLAELLQPYEKIVTITGAGLSTESGIPDYRGPNGSYSRGHKPMTHDQFINSAYHRSRYWARSMIGYETFAEARPNIGHLAIAQLEEIGKQRHLITQNVDGLHEKAGSKRVTDLHGRNDRVACLQCRHTIQRMEFQKTLRESNVAWIKQYVPKDELQVFADGDVDLRIDFSTFQVPSCQACGAGTLKPEVVFFGDSVPSMRVQACYAHVDCADAILVAGTSLMVYSSWRFVDAAHKRGLPIIILNLGPTRAEKAAVPHTKIESPTGVTLSGAVALLQQTQASSRPLMASVQDLVR